MSSGVALISELLGMCGHVFFTINPTSYLTLSSHIR